MMMVVPGLADLQLLSAGSVEDLGTGHMNVPLTIYSVDVVVDDEDVSEATEELMRWTSNQWQMLLWRSRSQRCLGVCCNQPQTSPQCP